MERNADDMFGATGSQSSPSTGSSASSQSGTGMAGSNAPPGGLDHSIDNSANAATSTLANTADQAATVAHDKFGKVKDKARELQSTLADRLDAGAEKLRHKNQNATLAGATEGSAVPVAAENRMTNMQDSVARGMSKSADWLRNGDLKGDIEKQVRENPGRTLLITLGVGYLLGKVFRNNSNR
jgi:ElaB/YqjD/DUF883 family membrane-anchored ribosome-binding protein